VKYRCPEKLQIPIVFIWQDYITYWGHRIFHLPFLYKNFHKLHHTYKQPTAFSVTAIHPVEFVIFQGIYISPMFIFTVHWVPFSFILMYTYYHGIIDHSGITFKRQWWQPWQPDCIFHDNHHQYFHVNFGFNIEYWDKLHGTYRRKDRIYHEDTFYGQGKSISDATEDELKQDITERVSENPLAYSGNKLHFELTEDEIMAKKAL
jgi:lathosterol oxidase